MAGNDPRLQGCSLTPFRVHSVPDLVWGVVPDGKLSHFTVGRGDCPLPSHSHPISERKSF